MFNMITNNLINILLRNILNGVCSFKFVQLPEVTKNNYMDIVM